MITDRDISILLAICRYYILSRPQIQRLCFPADTSGRVTRRRLAYLVDARLLNRQHVLYSQPTGGSPATVYFPAALGCELLAQHFDNESFLVTSTQAPIPFHINHWLSVSSTHLAFDAAIAGQAEARIDSWLNEYDVANKEEHNPEKRYRLYTLLKESPRLVCTPDAGFLLSMSGHKKVFYLEQDRATSGARHVAESKTRGYAAMQELKLHRKHFPEATVDSFTVILVAPTAARRDTLRRAILGRPGDSLWKFTTVDDLELPDLLYAPVFHPCEGPATSLLRRKES